MMVHPEKLDFAGLAEARVSAGRTMKSGDPRWRVIRADGRRVGDEGDNQSVPTEPSYGVSDVFHDQTASKAPACGFGLDKLGLASAAAPVSDEKSGSPTLSLLAKPHAGRPRPTVDPGSELGLHVHLASKAVGVGSAPAEPHWRPAESDPKPEVQPPRTSSQAPSPGSPRQGHYDRQLLRMIDVWPSLSVGVRDAIIAMAEASLER